MPTTDTERSRGCWLVALAVFGMVVMVSPWARAEGVDPPPEGLAGQLEELARWLEQQGYETPCEERCYTLDRLRLTGDVEAGAFEFELQGSVLSDGAVFVPLFGPASQVRVEEAMLDAAAARISFEQDSYYFLADARSFTLRGRFVLQGDRVLSIPGPLNTLEADLTNGRLVEGARLSGLRAATVHFERGAGAPEQEEPPVFQLSRAIRVGRELTFEYQLELRSGNDLGVVRLPLRFGEQVVEVTGSTGWRADGGVLTLPTSGRTAQLTIVGRMASVSTAAPDDRSSYEWWLFESDAEHRVTVDGGSRQFDVAESPIEPTQPNARLFMVQRGQDLRIQVQRLFGLEVLGAVVRSHDRRVVLTRQGGLISQDELLYDNNGVDYLTLRPQGKAIFLATDSRAERILQKNRGDRQLLVPLRTGVHSLTVQTLGQHRIGLLWGRLEVPTPEHQLTTSRVSLELGLPWFVHPLALVGGDEVQWFFGLVDLGALLLGALGAVVVLRGRRRRALGAAVLCGLWLLSPALFVVALSALATGGGLWLLTRLLGGRRRLVALAGLVLVAGTACVLALSATMPRGLTWPSPPTDLPAAATSDERFMAMEVLEQEVIVDEGSHETAGSRMAQLAQGGMIEGVTPVQLPLPAYSRWASASRELVSDHQPFAPVLYYVTDRALWSLAAVWLACLALLGAAYRRDLAALHGKLRQRLARCEQSRLAPVAPAQPDDAPRPE